jgi:hypothetical protein
MTSLYQPQQQQLLYQPQQQQVYETPEEYQKRMNALIRQQQLTEYKQKMQQIPGSELTNDQLNEMTLNYNKIYKNLFQILSTEDGNKYIDSLNLFPLVQSQSPIKQENMNNVFKHLLAYTYSATASEVANHEQINAQLKEIKSELKKIINKDAKIEPGT